MTEILLGLSVCSNIAILIISLQNGRRVQQVHLATNSMKDELVEATRVAALAAGVLQGTIEEKARKHDQGP